MTSALLTACNSSETTSSAAGVDTGDVALLITDAPTSAYDEINVETEQVSLVGEGIGGEAHLMNRAARFNLLDLRNTFRRLSKCKAPVGTYSKVRFRIKDVELVKWNSDGSATRHKAHMRKKTIDLTALKQFAVSRHHKLVVKLDLDADKSLKPETVTDPDTGETVPVFDPEATVDTDTVPTDTDVPPQEATPVLMNELGELRNPLTDSFELCNTDISNDCVQVNVSADTVVMNSSLVSAGIVDLENTTVQVFGHLDVNTDTINALRVLQDSQQLRSYSGTLSGDYDPVNDQINLDVAGTVYPVKPVTSSGIYDSAGNVVAASNLVDGVNVEVIGSIFMAFPPPGTLQPGVIIVSDPQ